MRFGLVHRVMTDALAALGVLAVVSTASLSLVDERRCSSSASPSRIAIPESWQGRPALRHFATVAPLALLAVQGGAPPRRALRRSTSRSSSRRSCRSSASRRAAAPPTTSRSSSSRCSTSSPGRCSAAGLDLRALLPRLPRRRAGRARAQPPAPRGRGQLPPGRARSHRVSRSTCRASCAAAASSGAGSSRRRACSRCRSSLFTAVALRPLPARRAVAPAPQPSARRAHDRLLGARRPRRGRRAARRPDRSRCASRCTDLPEPPPTRLTLRLRGTAFDAYDGRAWARTQHDAIRPSEHGSTATETYPLFRDPDPAHDRVVSFDLEPIDPPVVFLPPRAVALHLKVPTQILLGEPVDAPARPPRTSCATPAPTPAASATTCTSPANARGSSSRSRPATGLATSRSRRPARRASPTSPTRGPTALPTPQEKARGHRGSPPPRVQLRPALAVAGTPQPVDHFLFESQAGPLRVLLDGDGADAPRRSASRRAT